MSKTKLEYWKPALNELASFLLVQQKEYEVVKQVQLLSEAFNERNELLKDYFHKEKFVSSYAQFFLPTNIPKLTFILNQVPELCDLFLDQTSQFIDFGCGPGTYSLAWLKHFPKSEVLPIDHAQMMVNQAERLISGLFGHKRLVKKLDEQKKRVLFFGNVVNEMSLKEVLKVVDKYNPQYIMMIEPGTSVEFKKMLKLRTELIKRGHHCHYPCPSLDICPLEKNDTDWCHQVLRITHHMEVERLGQLAKKDRKIMPLIGHIYSLDSAKVLYPHHITRYLKESKHSFEYELCHEVEDKLKIKRLLIPKSKIEKRKIKELKKGSVGERLSIEKISESESEIKAKI